MSLRVFDVRFPYVCACGCEERMPVGTESVYGGEGLIVSLQHYKEEETFSEKERAEARKKMCSKCFMVHAGECL